MTGGATKIGRYEILGELGRGGMGVVYDAYDPALERPVAVKVIRFESASGLTASPEVEARFLREARLAARLQHPSVAAVYDAGRDGSSLFLVMEKVEGESLASRLQRADFPVAAAALRIVAQVADALAAAHAVGVVHRDVKPANILLKRSGDVKVSDFGVAKAIGDTTELTHTGSVLGSPAYMAPEQVQGLDIDGRADLFSLGVVLYELLLRRKPFPADTVTTLIYQILHQDPFTDAESLRPLGADVAAFLRWSLAKQPGQRVPDAVTFAARARVLADHPPQLVVTSPAFLQTQRVPLPPLDPPTGEMLEPRAAAPTWQPPIPPERVPLPQRAAPEQTIEPTTLPPLPPLPVAALAVRELPPPATPPRTRPRWLWPVLGGGVLLLGLVLAGIWALGGPPAPPPSLGGGTSGPGAPPPASQPAPAATTEAIPGIASPNPKKDEATAAIGQIVDRTGSETPTAAVEVPVHPSTPAIEAQVETAPPVTPPYQPPAEISTAFRCRKAAEFNVSPEEAHVAIDGKDIGIADDWDGSGGGKDYALGPGVYVSCFSLPKYKTACVRLVISAEAGDDVCDVDTELEKDRHSSG